MGSSFTENSELIKQQMAEEDAAWHHIVTYVFGDQEKNLRGNRNEGVECCMTSRSGKWCRRSQPGHLHLGTFQGHHHLQADDNRNGLNLKVTNWVHQFSLLAVCVLTMNQLSAIMNLLHPFLT